MKKLVLEPKMTDEEAKKLSGEMLTDHSYDLLIDEDIDVDKSDGTPLLRFRKNALSSDSCIVAYHAMRTAPELTTNRGAAAGNIKPGELRKDIIGRNCDAVVAGVRYYPVLKNGTLSKSNAAKQVTSSTVGFLDRSPRLPYCRMTKWTQDNIPDFHRSLPFFQDCSRVFKEVLPERWHRQFVECNKAHSDFRIGDTCFTTITVNKNWQTAVHQDKGDYAEGFGVMTAMWAGEGDGLHLVFPQYKVAVRIRSTDILLADVHEWHGNSPLHGQLGKYERLSFVLYLRSKVTSCLSAKEELSKARNMKRRGISE